MPSHASPCRNIYNVPLNVPFVDALAAHLLGQYGEAPDALARMLVLVPTRRAVTSLRDTLLRHSGGRPLLLPRIQPIGEIDVELAMPEVLWAQDAAARPELPPALSPRQRIFELARLIEAFQRHGESGVAADQSVLLAQALGDLIDDLAREEVPYARLETLVEGELAHHWQKTLAFLKIITEAWPQRLAELRRIDAVERRSRILRLLADHWQAQPPAHPVIAAGTTGSIPATARLLEVIARLPEGKVILPGLDQSCDDEQWQAIRRAVSHPQYGLQQLLKRVGCEWGEVKELPHNPSPCLRGEVGRGADAGSEPIEAPLPPPQPSPVNRGGGVMNRLAFLNAVMMPAELSHRWRELAFDASVLDGLAMVECEDEQEESQAIALMLRDALESPDTQAMLVTHDRALARRVAVLLRRYGLAVEDGGGHPLINTPAAVLAMLALRAAEAEAPAEVLALLKHPLCRLGASPEVKFKSVCEIELTFFRGMRTGETLAERVARIPALEEFSPDAATLMTRLTQALQPLVDLFQQSRVALPVAHKVLVEALERLAETPEEPGAARLWNEQSGHLLSQQLADIYDHSSYLGEVEPGTLGALFARLLSRETFQPVHATHPRLTILSPADARMQHADLVILAGLNEGCWPPAPQSDPWMSRAMRESIGLQPYERQIGQAAHDFLSLACAAPRVILTRARKVAGSPTLASRWWLRLSTVLEAMPEEARAAFAAKGTMWLEWCEEFSAAERTESHDRPRPMPPASARPRTISVSQVERLMRDPYAFYAQCILRLRPLDPIDKEPGMAEFGNAVHAALERFARRYPEQLPANAEAELMAMIDASFAELIYRVKAPSFWRRRLQRIVQEVIALERGRRQLLLYIEAERPMETSLTLPSGPFTLKARLDRIDHLRGSGADIIDFKTGSVPSGRAVRAGLSPQLTLEGLLLQEAGLAVHQLLYWKVPAGTKPNPLEQAGGSSADPAQLIAEARDGLHRLLGWFERADTPYPCLADTSAALAHNDYDHLERMEEWR